MPVDFATLLLFLDIADNRELSLWTAIDRSSTSKSKPRDSVLRSPLDTVSKEKRNDRHQHERFSSSHDDEHLILTIDFRPSEGHGLRSAE